MPLCDSTLTCFRVSSYPFTCPAFFVVLIDKGRPCRVENFVSELVGVRLVVKITVGISTRCAPRHSLDLFTQRGGCSVSSSAQYSSSASPEDRHPGTKCSEMKL